ncbi:MAG TPA: site-2 protease family protein [Roseiflexaceae bacterium]|nr:site-2 protease family protein [Roseiflexaceae bacterium]
MAWSFRLGAVAGIPIRIHPTFFLVIGLGALLWGREHGAIGALFGVLMMVLLFGCVTLHELGHALAARRVGIATNAILLQPIGGLAMLARSPSKPAHELLISAAGPLANALLVVVLALAGALSGAFASVTPDNLAVRLDEVSVTGALLWLIQANIALALFNLLPAFPLDGGRMLRALLSFKLGPATATRIATYTGQGVAILLGAYALTTGNLVLGLVALVVYLGAGQERLEERTQSALERVTVGEVYNRHALALGLGDRVETAANYLLTSPQQDFAVLREQTLLGVVTRADVLRALAEGRGREFITLAMRRDVVYVDVAATLEAVRQTMAERGTRVVAVVEGGVFRGLVSLEDIIEAGAVSEALRHSRSTRPAQQAG